MRPHVWAEVAILAFFEAHRRCGELDSVIEDGRVWMRCDCGASLVHAANAGVRLLD